MDWFRAVMPSELAILRSFLLWIRGECLAPRMAGRRREQWNGPNKPRRFRRCRGSGSGSETSLGSTWISTTRALWYPLRGVSPSMVDSETVGLFRKRRNSPKRANRVAWHQPLSVSAPTVSPRSDRGSAQFIYLAGVPTVGCSSKPSLPELIYLSPTTF